MTTLKLYWQDAYLKSFKAKIIKIDGHKVWLDKTCFYPESGGQCGDKGLLQGQCVIDTKLDADKDIIHILEETPKFQVGEEILGEINWERRHKIMRVHSASHIMEHFLIKVFGPLKLLGSNLNELRDSSTYFSEEPLEVGKLKTVEELSNIFIKKNLPIITFFDETKPNFRIWQCDEIQIPCGGTHPLNTEEIGQIQLKREKGGKNKEKVITTLLS